MIKTITIIDTEEGPVKVSTRDKNKIVWTKYGRMDYRYKINKLIEKKYL